MTGRAVLALENGLVFEGVAIGARGSSVGEVVFNTAITGYQEILTDPSYAKQIVTLTYPHIGNTGVNEEDEESTGVWVAGLIIRDLPLLASSWRKESSLSDYLVKNEIVAIAEIDTRRLTRVLREQGSQKGCVVADETIDDPVIKKAIEQARNFAGLEGMDLAKEVTVDKAYTWEQGSWRMGEGYRVADDLPFHVVVYDFGREGDYPAHAG